MSEHEPLHGYNHSLTISQIVGRMIDFDEKANEAPLEIVLDDWVEDAEYRHEKAERRDAPPEQLEELVNEVHRRRAKRGDTMKMYTELCLAADEISQGHNHPQLVLCRPQYERGSPEFTIYSAYKWAEARGKIVPEWERPGEQSSAVPSQSDDSDLVATRNIRATIFIIARALGGLIDKLEQDEYISTPNDQPCINKDDVENLTAITDYIASIGNSDLVADEPTPANCIYNLALATVTLSLARLADQARTEGWVQFHDKHKAADTRPFLRSGQYVTIRIYDYLVTTQAIRQSDKNQGKRIVQQRLNDAKKLVGSTESQGLSKGQLLNALESARKS